MKTEALNCPNCGAAVSSDATQCLFCRSRLKTVACPSCFGAMFLGNRHCSHCGAKTVQPEIKIGEIFGDCPRCKTKLDSLQIDEVTLRECKKCQGLWADAETFENLCASRESQAAVLAFTAERRAGNNNLKINYVPCPGCKELMNRSNFALSSGVIIDICKKHGVWFDAEELTKIIDFIRKGGLDYARKKEKVKLEDERNRLREERLAFERSAFKESNDDWDSSASPFVRQFVRFLFD